MPRLIPSILIMAAVCAGNVSAAEPARPLVIAHRGASGYLPEHTLESYARAIDQGADYIEADLVVTKDGYLVARHENELSDTTDIALRFPNRKTTKTIDGSMVEGWFSEDFNLDELSTVRAKERLAFRDQSNNSHFHIPTIAEILTLRAAKQRETGRTIGVYIETKHPSYFRAMGLPMEEPLLSILTAWALDRPGSPVFLESFEADSVWRMGEGTAVPVIYLLAEGSPETTDESLGAIARFAEGIGPAKSLIVPVDAKGRTGPPTDLVARAHQAGLLVHPYTFRPEIQFLPVTYAGDAGKEYCQFAQLGVDGVFTDTPDLALKAFGESYPMPK